MEAPTPIHIEDFQNTIFEHPFKEEEEYSLNKETKEYILEIDNISYKLIIYSENNEIIFSIEKNNELLLYNYKSKYNFKEIISILKLPLDIYNDTNKIIDLIDKAYDKNKILLKFDENKINIFLIIKMGLGFQEIDFPIKINRNDYNINQKFDIILKELLFLRQNKQLIIDSQLLEIEKIVKLLKETVNEKLNDNFLLIEKLRQKIENNEKLLENNKNEIQYLKDEIINIKDKEKLS